jgi:SAGA-associated factor 29
MSVSGAGTPAPTPQNRITLNVKGDRDRDRSSEGPSSTSTTAQTPTAPPVKRDAKARAKFYNKQHPLREGRNVAFHPPSAEGGGAEAENTWILAVVTKCLNQEKHR